MDRNPFSLVSISNQHNPFRVELYRYTLKSLRKEEMLKAINKKYKGIDLTLDDVMKHVKFVRRLKIPFAVLELLFLVVEMVTLLW
jgi:hypothetical protein